MSRSLSILVAGATGYVGGRLVARLLAAGHRVRVLVRNPARLQGQDWADDVEVVPGDVLDPATLAPALDGIDVAYYLIHSLPSGDNFDRQDVIAAENFGSAARSAAVQRIIYLGGLGDPDANLSQHLRSRQKTGQALRSAGTPVTELRAAIIVGAGSISFEMIRYLTERLPVMICPRWVYSRVQPIAIEDVLAYLLAVLETPDSIGRIIEIGGPDVLTYGAMLLGYAKARGLRRWLIPVPVLTPRLSSHWVGWMTPLSPEIARPLVDGLRNEVIVRDDSAARLFPQIKPQNYQTALSKALAHLDESEIELSWDMALASQPISGLRVARATRQGVFIERRQVLVNAPPEVVYAQFTHLGGEPGWPYANWVWQLRAWLDRLAGGKGSQGRSNPFTLQLGDTVDLWRVESVDPSHELRLRADMKIPGSAWLNFEAQPQPGGETLLVQTNLFAPKGLSGFLSWYLLIPIHRVVFVGLLKALKRRSELQARASAQPAWSHA